MIRTQEELIKAIELVQGDQKQISRSTNLKVIFAINNTLEILRWCNGDTNTFSNMLEKIEKRQNATNHNS